MDSYDDWGVVNGTTFADREWKVPINNYDNIFSSMMTFFEICGLEIWPEKLWRGIDAYKIDHIPV